MVSPSDLLFVFAVLASSPFDLLFDLACSVVVAVVVGCGDVVVGFPVRYSVLLPMAVFAALSDLTRDTQWQCSVANDNAIQNPSTMSHGSFRNDFA